MNDDHRELPGDEQPNLPRAQAPLQPPPAGATPSSDPIEPLEIGTTLLDGRFKLLRQIGAGGMGLVFEALDAERNLRVALKTLRATNPQTLYRFKQEFRALSEFVHPHLVPLYELFADRDRWFITMELIDDGVDLLRYCRRSDALSEAPTELSAAYSNTTVARGPADASQSQWVDEAATSHAPTRLGSAPPDYERLRDAFVSLAEGVSVLHAAGRLHRDLKPENVYVRACGTVVLLDFGLVAALEEPEASRVSRDPAPSAQTEACAVEAELAEPTYRATCAGVIAGTVRYMAPEQALDMPLTAACDWYAVGVMLYEALTGQLPYQGSDVRVITDKQSVDPRPPSELVADTPHDLDSLCMELLQRDPTMRPHGPEVVLRLRGAETAETHDSGAAPRPRIFIGRAAQRASLHRALRRAQEATVVVRVRGASGAGKSALLSAFADDLARRPEVLVLSGRCYEQESIPFKAIDMVMDRLSQHLLRCSPERLAQLAPADAGLVGKVFPGLGRAFPPLRSVGEPLLELRRRAFAAVRELLCKLAQHVRLVLCIDDLQWGDVDSARLLADILSGPDAPRMLLVLAFRSEHDAQVPCLRRIAAASRAACARGDEIDLDVGALGSEDAYALARVLLGDACEQETLTWTVGQAGGSAFLLQELAEHVVAGRARAVAEGLALDDILWQRVQSLPEPTRRLLVAVAAAGRPVPLRYACRAAQLHAVPPQVVALLRSQRLARTDGAGLDSEIETFHDRIRESIVARTPARDVATYCEALADAIESDRDADPEALAALYQQAGQLGRASRHYAAAVPRAVAALAFNRAQALCAKAIELARTDEEVLLAHEAAVHFHTDMARFDQAYDLTRQGVGRLGVELPSGVASVGFLYDLLAVEAALLRKRPAELLALHSMPEGRLRHAVRLANAGAKAAYQVRPELCVAVCTKLVRLCLTHGNSPDCAVGYMVFGSIFLGGILGRYHAGYELGRLALALVDKYRNERQRAEVCFVVGYFGTSWLRPAREAEALWQIAFDAGRASGDLFHMGCAAAGRMMSLHMRGAPLDAVETEANTVVDVLRHHGLREPLAVVSAIRQLARDLRGKTLAPGDWRDADYDEEREGAAWLQFGARHFGHYCLLARAQTWYLRGDYTRAARALATADALAPASRGMLHSAEHIFVDALVTAARAGTLRGTARQRARVVVWRAARRFSKWAAGCPENFQAKAHLLWAEARRLTGRRVAALQAYDEAARSASRYEQPHVAAIAQLRAAALHDQAGARVARANAGRSFARWGATALAGPSEGSALS